MNARIEKLAEQAGATVITTHGMEHVVDGCYVIGPARLEKFAELIVRECVYFVGDLNSQKAKEMLEHFGVKE